LAVNYRKLQVGNQVNPNQGFDILSAVREKNSKSKYCRFDEPIQSLEQYLYVLSVLIKLFDGGGLVVKHIGYKFECITSPWVFVDNQTGFCSTFNRI
jgi:hypothetical protein